MMFSKLFVVLVAAVAAIGSHEATGTDNAHLAREIDSKGDLVMREDHMAEETETTGHLRQGDTTSLVEKVDKVAMLEEKVAMLEEKVAMLEGKVNKEDTDSNGLREALSVATGTAGFDDSERKPKSSTRRRR